MAGLLLLASVLLACAGGAGGDETGWLVRYERAWPDGMSERQEIWPDGRLLMWHGEHLERLTIDDDDVLRLQSALEADIPVGTADDEPRRVLTLEDGSVIEFVRPEPGSAAELLERLLDRHTLDP
jgi:hypothetical protein